MQLLKQIKSANRKSEEPDDTPQTSRAGVPGQHFVIEFFQYAVRDTKRKISLSTQFLVDTGAPRSIINCDTLTQIRKSQTILVMALAKSPLTANGHAMPMQGKVLVQSASDVLYTRVILIGYDSDFTETRGDILGMDFLAKFGEFTTLRNPMLIWTVFSGKGVKLPPYLAKLCAYQAQVNSIDLSHDLTLAPPSTRVSIFSQTRRQTLVHKKNEFPSV